MKKINIFTLSLLCLGLIACGGKKDKSQSDSSESDEIVMTPESTEITGDLEGCYTIVDRQYKPNKDVFQTVAIELQRSDKAFPFDESFGEFSSFSTSSKDPKIKVGFGIEFLDEDGNIIAKADPSSTPYSHEEPVTLAKLKNGGKASIRFTISSQEDAAKIKTFRITSAVENDPGWGEKSSKSSTPSIPDYSDEIEKAKKQYDDAYRKAEKEYDDAYNKAKKQYDDAYEDAKRQLGL